MFCFLVSITTGSKAQNKVADHHSDTASKEKKSFKIFDAIGYLNRPNLTKEGLTKINLIYEVRLTQKDSMNPRVSIIDTSKVIARAKEALLKPDELICFDIEEWWGIRDTKEVTRRYKEVVDVFRKYNKVSKIGFYGIGPLDLNNSRLLNNNDYEKAFKGWTFKNDLLSPSREYMDVLFPSLYIVNNEDMATWVKDLELSIQDARKSNKSIYAYIWPQYYDAPKSPEYKKFIDPATWTFILENCYRLCDGVVIWSSSTDENKAIVTWGDPKMMPFWEATKAFIKKHNIK